jgi:hypothetical protein
MKILLRAAVAATLLIHTFAGAMEVARQGDTMVMMGKVVPEDLESFKAQLAAGPLRTVILANNPGGDLRAALWIARQISAHKITTVVQGACISACAVMFMGGQVRQMMDGVALHLNRIGFHGAHKKDDYSISEKGSEAAGAWIREASGGKFSGELLERAMKIRLAADVMFFYYPRPGRTSAFFCPVGAKPRPTACEQLPDTDALKAGVLTTAELYSPITPLAPTSEPQ